MAELESIRDDALGRLLAFGPVAARHMFGGFGLFLDGVMFGLVAEGALYFKVDAVNRPEFEAAGSAPFAHRGRRRILVMSYYQVPAEVFDDIARLADWAERAHAAARRARAKCDGGGRSARRAGAD